MSRHDRSRRDRGRGRHPDLLRHRIRRRPGLPVNPPIVPLRFGSDHERARHLSDRGHQERRPANGGERCAPRHRRLYLALIFWTFADARRRIDDPLLVACATACSFFPFVGTIVYLIVRPPEFLDDVRLRELEMTAAEARLASLDYSLCPHCDYEVQVGLPALSRAACASSRSAATRARSRSTRRGASARSARPRRARRSPSATSARRRRRQTTDQPTVAADLGTTTRRARARVVEAGTGETSRRRRR